MEFQAPKPPRIIFFAVRDYSETLGGKNERKARY
jgi:hypothetical protein